MPTWNSTCHRATPRGRTAGRRIIPPWHPCSDWRGRGVAAALLCASLRELRDRGLSEAALGADVDNPSAFGLYQRLGFVVTTYEAVYRKAIG